MRLVKQIFSIILRPLVWGTRGRGFKSRQPDLPIMDFYESKD